MTIRRILVPVLGKEDPESGAMLEVPALETGFSLGERFGARVDVLCIEAARTTGLPWWIPDSGLDELLDLIERRDAQRRDQARAIFDRIAGERRPPISEPDETRTGYSVSFVELTEDSGSLAAHGRLADLIVLAHAGIPPEALVEDLLRDTGRPVLVLPRTTSSPALDHIALAWNGSLEAARAVAFGMDFLRAANRITVIAVNEEREPSASRLVDYLSHHGLEAGVERAQSPRLEAAETLLQEVGRTGADVLLMGAHSRNRFRELILGDVTDLVLRRAEIPTMLVH